MVVLNAKQTAEVGSLPDHIIDNMRPNGRVSEALRAGGGAHGSDR